MVLHEEGEHKFYQKVRKATGPMWVPGSGDSEDVKHENRAKGWLRKSGSFRSRPRS